MDDHDPLVERLGALGRQPIDPATSSRHLRAMAGAPPPKRGGSWTRLKVGAAFAAGLVLGGTGLASAGVLPGPAQDIAHTTLSKVGVNVPQGTERFNDPAVCGLDPATGQPFRNHGQYVKAHKGDPAAAQSRCGKPLKAGTSTDPATPPDPTKNPADPAAPSGGPGNGNGNGNGRGNSGKVKPAKVKEKGPDEPKEPAAPAAPPAPATTAPPAPPPSAAAVVTTTTVPAPTTTSSAPTTTTTLAR